MHDVFLFLHGILFTVYADNNTLFFVKDSRTGLEEVKKFLFDSLDNLGHSGIWAYNLRKRDGK